MTPAIAILCFHRVLPSSYAEGPDKPYFLRQTALSLERFRSLLDDVAANATILPPETFVAWTQGKYEPDRPAAVLTFDDGYQDLWTYAWPELERRGLRAVVCVSTATLAESYVFPVDRWYAAVMAAKVRQGALIGFGADAWHFDLDLDADLRRLIDGPEKRVYVQADATTQKVLLARLQNALGVGHVPSTPALLDGREIQSLVDAGCLLASHGHHHVHWSGLTDKMLQSEIEATRAVFRAHAWPAPDIVAYPDGAIDDRSEGIAYASGFSIGLALGSRVAMPSDSRLRLPRFIPTNDSTWCARRLGEFFKSATR